VDGRTTGRTWLTYFSSSVTASNEELKKKTNSSTLHPWLIIVSDVDRGQTPEDEAEDEDKTPRPRTRTRTKSVRDQIPRRSNVVVVHAGDGQ